MFVNIGPAEYNLEESVTTLVYGSRAKLITNSTQKNVESQAQARINEAFKTLQAQLELAVNELMRRNIPIPHGIDYEPIKEMKADDLRDEPEMDIGNFPEIKGI